MSREVTRVNELIPNQLRQGSQQFSRFLEEYYRFLNSPNDGPSHLIQNIISNHNIDQIVDPIFLNKIQYEIAQGVPESPYVIKSFLLKRIIDFYGIRGTQESIRYFFRIFYNRDVKVNEPWSRVLIPSQGNWRTNIILRVVTENESNGQLFSQKDIEQNNQAFAFVDRVISQRYAKETIHFLVLNQESLQGSFNSGEIVSTSDGSVQGTVYRTLTNIRIVNGGTGYQIGDKISIRGLQRETFRAIVRDVSSTGRILEIEIIDPGSGNTVFFDAENELHLVDFQLKRGAELSSSIINRSISDDFDLRLKQRAQLNHDTIGFDQDYAAENELYFFNDYGSLVNLYYQEIRRSKTAQARINNIDPTIDVQTESGKDARFFLEFGPIFRTSGRYLNEKGRTSEDSIIQDSFYFQKFSYEIGSDLSLKDWKEIFGDFVHPGGFQLFGKNISEIEISVSPNIATRIDLLFPLNLPTIQATEKLSILNSVEAVEQSYFLNQNENALGIVNRYCLEDYVANESETIQSVDGEEIIKQPTNLSFSLNENSEILLLVASPFESVFTNQSGAQFQISTTDSFNTILVDSEINGSSIQSASVNWFENLEASTEYFWRVRYFDSFENYSEWSTPTAFVTLDNKQFVESPTILSPQNNSMSVVGSGLGQLEILTAPFSVRNGTDIHVSTDWQVALDMQFQNIQFESLNNTNDLTFIEGDFLTPNTKYYARVRFQGQNLGYSEYSLIQFTTGSDLSVNIPIGTSIGGGFFVGNFNNENYLILAPKETIIVNDHDNIESWYSSSLSYSQNLLNTESISEGKVFQYRDWTIPSKDEFEFIASFYEDNSEFFDSFEYSEDPYFGTTDQWILDNDFVGRFPFVFVRKSGEEVSEEDFRVKDQRKVLAIRKIPVNRILSNPPSIQVDNLNERTTTPTLVDVNVSQDLTSEPILNVPGHQPGDLLIAFIADEETFAREARQPPEGWTGITYEDDIASIHFQIYFKIASNNEPSIYTFPWRASRFDPVYRAMLSYRNANLDQIGIPQKTGPFVRGATNLAPSINVNQINSKLLSFYKRTNGGQVPPLSPSQSFGTTIVNLPGMIIVEENLPNQSQGIPYGETGDRVFNVAGESKKQMAFQVALSS